MASWYNNLLTNASSNITKLQRTYFGGESDGDTADDTLVCRVLRGHYTEKGQAFPGWLPPDPRAPPPQQASLASPTPSAASGATAQEKLKQRLWGGARTTSPNAGGPFQPPAGQAPPQAQSQAGGNRWGWGNGGGGDGGGGAQPARRTDRPVMSANAPWSDGGFDNPAGGAGGGRGYGLPSGPRGGLPSGPRPR
ncbi:hypothetical protein BT67DRAFT_370035 [Trichocladium antarcticum]|uniref:Mso1 N-terminal domain-containing protein n=1 Tax=Trichocladium antarcticum TaxID=1450529 RepID=A0AAN6USZ8_9PEZI|nr:hypothetical protein BT67DRAFT_370035 [Trichocladium antarcticum]